MVSKDNQEGGINQCFYFDITLNKRLYIASNYPGPSLTEMAGFASLLRRSGYEGQAAAMATTAELEYRNEIFSMCVGHGHDC